MMIMSRLIEVKQYDKSKINYCYYTFDNKVEQIPVFLEDVVKVFKRNQKKIDSTLEETMHKSSNEVLKEITNSLKRLDYDVEEGKKKKIEIRIEEDSSNHKKFNVDALHRTEKIIIEVEAGVAVANNNFLKDIMECEIISSKGKVFVKGTKRDLKNPYLIIAVKNKYHFKSKKNNKFTTNKDYKNIVKWLRDFESSNLKLNIEGILLIGY